MRQAPAAPPISIGQRCCPSSQFRILLALCLPRQPSYPPSRREGESRQTGRRVCWPLSEARLGGGGGCNWGQGGWRIPGAEAGELSLFREPSPLFRVPRLGLCGPCQPCPTPTTARDSEEKRPRGGSSCSIISDPPAMEDLDQSPLVSSSADSPPRPPPAFQYQFVTDPEYEEDEEEEDEEEEEDDEDLEELEVLERKPAVGLSAAPVPPAAAAPLLDFGSDSVPPAPRGPLPAAPPAAPERQPSWERSPAAPAPSLPAAAAVLPSKLPEDDEPPARPPPPPPAGASPLAEPAAPPSTPAAPKRRGSGSVGECRRAPSLPTLPLLCVGPGGGGRRQGCLGTRGALSASGWAMAPPQAGGMQKGGAAAEARAPSLSVPVSGSTCTPAKSLALRSGHHSVALPKLDTAAIFSCYVCVEELGLWIP